MSTLNIIIPHYNRVELCIECLESIYQEADNDKIKVIVVDDNSTDDTIELEKYLINHNGIFVKNRFKKGAGGARNTGIQEIDNRLAYVMFVDSDDNLLKGWYDSIQFETTKNSDAEVIYFKNDTNRMFHNKLLDKYYLKQSNKNECLELLFRVTVPWGKLFKTNLILENKIKFDEVSKAEDVNFSVQALIISEKIAISKFIIYHYNFHEGNLSSFYSKVNWEDFKAVMYKKGDLIYTYLKENHLRYRDLGTYLIVEGKRAGIGVKEYISILKGIKKHHMYIFPSLSQIINR